jgi:hypothetical protein
MQECVPHSDQEMDGSEHSHDPNAQKPKPFGD